MVNAEKTNLEMSEMLNNKNLFQRKGFLDNEQMLDNSKDIVEKYIIEYLNKLDEKAAIDLWKYIHKFIAVVRIYDNMHFSNKDVQLKYERGLVYRAFFNLQNKINDIFNRTIVMTYVYIDKKGDRTIYTYDNDITHLGITPFRGGLKLTYLETNLTKPLGRDEKLDNKRYYDTLNWTAKAVTKRREKYHGVVLWYKEGSDQGWIARKTGMGPINEAYAQFYIHAKEAIDERCFILQTAEPKQLYISTRRRKKGNEWPIQINSTLENNIHTYMLHSKYGAVTADATAGFMLGDASAISDNSTDFLSERFQYAIKGQSASPQGWRAVYNFIIENFPNQQKFIRAFRSNIGLFAEKFIKDELNKTYAPQIKQMTNQKISSLLAHLKIGNSHISQNFLTSDK